MTGLYVPEKAKGIVFTHEKQRVIFGNQVKPFKVSINFAFLYGNQLYKKHLTLRCSLRL